MNEVLERLGIRPRPFRAMVWALWTMDLRGQHFARSTGVKPKMVMSPLFWVIGQCLTLSCLAALFLFARVGLHFYVFANLTLSLGLLATMVLVEFHEVVLNPSDEETIRHRPVPPRTYAAARFANLLLYVALMGFALTVFPAVVGANAADGGWLYLPAYLIASFAGSMVVVAAIVWTMSLGGALRQLKDLLAWSQILGILIIVYGGQYVFRDSSHAFFLWAAFPPDELAWIPTHWLSTFVVEASRSPSLRVFGVAAGLLALGTACGASVVFRLRSLYGRARQPQARAAISSSGVVGTVDPGLGPLLKNHAERAGFWMALRMLGRDGQLKIRVLLPLNTPIAVVFLGLATAQLGTPALDGNAILSLIAVYGVSLALAPVVYQLRTTPTPEAAWLFHTAPIARPIDLTLGAAKAVWLLIIGPMSIALAALLSWQWADPIAGILHGLLAFGLAWPLALLGLHYMPRAMVFSEIEGRGGSIGPLALPMAIVSTAASGVGLVHAVTGGHPLFIASALSIGAVISVPLRRTL